MEYKSFDMAETGTYSLTEFPGNGDLVVSHDVLIYPHLRGKGLGKTQHTKRLLHAANNGHSAIICTVREDNAIEKHILTENYWKKVWTFTNKMNEKIEVWAKELHI